MCLCVRRDDTGGGAGAVPGAPRHLSASGADAGAPPFDSAHSRVAAAMARVLALRALEQPDRPHRPELAALLVVIWCVSRSFWSHGAGRATSTRLLLRTSQRVGDRTDLKSNSPPGRVFLWAFGTAHFIQCAFLGACLSTGMFCRRRRGGGLGRLRGHDARSLSGRACACHAYGFFD
jgi:hypothetical protein